MIARRRDGSEFPCRIGVCKVPDSNLLVGYVKDITHEKKSEREHHLNESILDSSFESIVVADDEGKIVKVNASTLTTFGFDTSDEIVGQNVRVLVGGNEGHAEHHDMYLKEFRKRGGQSSLLVGLHLSCIKSGDSGGFVKRELASCSHALSNRSLYFSFWGG